MGVLKFGVFDFDMIGTLRKHNVWIWWIIIAATIIGFVGYLSPGRQFGTGRPTSSVDLGTVNGEPISQKDFASAEREGRLFFRMRFGQWPDTEEKMRQVDSFAYQRLLLAAQLKQMNIQVTPTAAAQVTKAMFGVPQDQAFPRDKFEEFMQNEIMAKGGLTLDDFDRYVRHEAGQQLLISLFGMSGKLITAKEGEFFYRREHEMATVEVASFPVSNFLDKVTVTPEDIENFYTKRQADYRLPDRVQLDYVKFEATNYFAAADKELGGITNLSERVEAAYLQAGPDAFKDADGKPLSADDAKAKLKKEFHQGVALREARKAANDFLNQLAQGHDKDHPIALAELQTLSKSNSLVAQTTAPFDQKNPPKELDVPAKALRMVFALQPGAPDDQFTTLVGEDAVYVVGLDKRLPSEIQTLFAVRPQVIKDYRQLKALDLVKAAGQSLDSALLAGMANGESFDAVCAAQNIKPIVLPPFSLSTESLADMPDKTFFEHIQSTIYNLPTGKASRFVESMDGGFIAYVKTRLPVDEATLRQDLPAYLAKMRDQRQQAAYSEWFGKQFQTRVVIPQAQRTRLSGSTG
jgi:hypothetical protein